MSAQRPGIASSFDRLGGEHGADNWQSGQQTPNDPYQAVPARIVGPVLGGCCWDGLVKGA